MGILMYLFGLIFLLAGVPAIAVAPPVGIFMMAFGILFLGLGASIRKRRY